MEYQTVTTWTVIKRFLIGWAVAGLILVAVSCVKYKELIITVFTNNTLAWINAMAPMAIAIIGIWYMLKSIFR